MHLFRRDPEPPAVPTPSATDLSRLRELIDAAVSLGVMAGLEHRAPFAQETDPLASPFAAYIAAVVAAKVGAVR